MDWPATVGRYATLGAHSLAVDGEHLNLFNPESLRRLVVSAGFEVLTVHTPGRLDAEFVREAALKGEIRLDPFLQRVLVSDWERLGWPFRMFLASMAYPHTCGSRRDAVSEGMRAVPKILLFDETPGPR